MTTMSTTPSPSPPPSTGPQTLAGTGPTQDQLVGYLNAKANVARYVAALQSTDISGVNFKTLPPDIEAKLPEDPATLLETVREHLTTAKSHGQFWSNDIQPALTAVPQAVINFNTQFQAELTLIEPLVQALLDQDDPAKRAELKELFGGLLGKIAEQQGAIATEITNLKQFNTDLTGDHTNFSSANDAFAAIQQFEEANITALDAAIKGLDAVISALNKAIIAEGVALGVSVGLIAGGAIGLASAETGVGLVVGAVCIVAGMIGVGVAAGELISSIEKEQEAEQKLAFDQLEVNELTVQVKALNTVEDALGNLVTESQSAMASVQAILDTWATLSAKVQAVVTDLDDAEQAIGNIMSLVDLETAKTQWAQLETFATQMQGFEDVVLSGPAQTLALPAMTVQATAA